MTDKKISQLTGATTPLAGTEVLPIVQGGSTVKVSAANLTAGRAVDTGNLKVTGNMAVNATPATYYGINLGNSATITGDANPRGITSSAVYGTDATGLVAALFGQVRSTAASYTMSDAIGVRLGDASKGAGSTITNLHGVYVQDLTSGDNNYGITSLVSSGANKWNLYASGTANNYMAGNLQFAAAKGIDFSANTHAAGMTSELLNDYEEGTWTPIFSDSSGNNATAQFSGGLYTKIGRLVSFQLYLININTTGLTAGDAARISLPYAMLANQYATAPVRLSNVTFSEMPIATVMPGTSYMNLWVAASGGAGADLLVSAVTSATGDIFISGSYQV